MARPSKAMLSGVRALLTARQKALLRDVLSATENNPAFRAVILDELSKQANAGRPRLHPASAAFARMMVEDELRRTPSVKAAIAAAAVRLGVSFAKVRAIWYAQPKAEREESLRVFGRSKI
ncbi:MAG: hypothetical protein AMXMBFR42_30090 [Burkholderiales bacterium]